jgi:predicted NBD/HSP70 family sugar kinase
VIERRRPPGNQASLREANRARIVEAVKRYGGLTQVELAGATGLSPATVSNIVKEMSASGVLHTAPATHSGRRALRVTLAHGLGLVVGVSVTQRQLRVALADLTGSVVAENHMPLARDHRADNELDKATLLIADLVDSVDAGMDELVGVGVAIAAPIDQRTSSIAARGILRGWDKVSIAKTLERRLHAVVHVDNASNLIAAAEWRTGAGRGKQNLVTVDIGDGIGAGIIAGGRPLRGHRGGAGELGHTTVDPDGPLCRCGHRGCLEAIAGVPAVLERLNDPRVVKTADLISGAIAGDDRCVRAIADAGRTVGRAVAGLCNLLDPERVIVSGDLVRAGELLLGPMRHALEAGLLLDADGTPDLVGGQLGPTAALTGAVMLAIDHAQILTDHHDDITIEPVATRLAFTT